MNKKHKTVWIRSSIFLLIAGWSPAFFAGCGPGGNTVIENEEGPMTEEELQAYEEQANQQTTDYEDNYR
ncbi:hypothetical protein [Rhodopirellula europaea]|uniref:Secreted protein n=1 Tax=Rhodopirellula europaea 6C TaxID=1263867 RepID=M2AHX3_9BACT|nr:hypothetical protein [Rhodopirellula europaea]EMB16740.1 hypothetical protein RE6C_02555 [Rhodopirellula europaea 6C]